MTEVDKKPKGMRDKDWEKIRKKTKSTYTMHIEPASFKAKLK